MISRLDTAGKRINELEGASTEISQTESRINTKNLHIYQNTEKRTQTAENQRWRENLERSQRQKHWTTKNKNKSHCSLETMQTRKEWVKYLKCWKKKITNKNSVSKEIMHQSEALSWTNKTERIQHYQTCLQEMLILLRRHYSPNQPTDDPY